MKRNSCQVADSECARFYKRGALKQRMSPTPRFFPAYVLTGWQFNINFPGLGLPKLAAANPASASLNICCRFSSSKSPLKKRIFQEKLWNNFPFHGIEKRSHAKFTLRDWLYSEHCRTKSYLNVIYRNCSWLISLLSNFRHA